MQELSPPEAIAPKPPVYCYYFSGLFSGGARNRSIENGLKRVYGENTRVLNSILSTDSKDIGNIRDSEQYYLQTAQQIIQQLENNSKVVLTAFSLGPSVLTRVMKKIEETNPQILKDKAKNLQVIMMAPAGFFKDINSAFSLVGRVSKVGLALADLPGPLSRLSSPWQEIESTSLIPITGLTIAQQATALRKAYGDKSQYEEGITEISDVEITKYVDHLDPKDRSELERLDNQLQDYIKAVDWDGFRKILKVRGRLLLKYVDKAYAGKYFPDGEKREEKVKLSMVESLRLKGAATLGLGRLFFDIFKGEPLKLLERLRKQGVPISFLIPEYDVLVKTKEIKEFFGLADEQIDSRMLLLSSFAHASWLFQADSLKKAVEEIEKNLAASHPV